MLFLQLAGPVAQSLFCKGTLVGTGADFAEAHSLATLLAQSSHKADERFWDITFHLLERTFVSYAQFPELARSLLAKEVWNTKELAEILSQHMCRQTFEVFQNAYRELEHFTFGYSPFADRLIFYGQQ